MRAGFASITALFAGAYAAQNTRMGFINGLPEQDPVRVWVPMARCGTSLDEIARVVACIASYGGA